MELSDAVAQRHMTRSFDGRPIPAAVVDRVVAAGLRAPSAGFTQGWAFVVLEGPEQTDAVWAVVEDAGRRSTSTRRGRERAPVVVLALCSPAEYTARYAEADKIGGGLDQEAAWPVPYWFCDTAMAVMLMLLTAVEEGLGALWFGLFGGEAALLGSLGVPPVWRAVGGLALGWPDGHDHPSPSRRRGRRPLDEVRHRGRW
jgi:nitroreductase